MNIKMWIVTVNRMETSLKNQLTDGQYMYTWFIYKYNVHVYTLYTIILTCTVGVKKKVNVFIPFHPV